jgi:NAD(P)-dependent dehydrogenase (short-subunit alcohol dehydrogenase family)
MGCFGRSSCGWEASDMPSQAGKVAVVTGANSGIGYETALQLARHGAHVVLACRSESRGRYAEQQLREALALAREDEKSPLAAEGSVEFMQVDIGEPASVREFASAFRVRFDRLDLLINNAGVSSPAQKTTAGGLEIHFGINHLGHFYLTCLLMDLLRRSQAARVVSVSSVMHRFGWIFLNFATMATLQNPDQWVYSRSKLLSLLFTYELHRRLLASGIGNVMAVAAHPGGCHTEIFNKKFSAGMPQFLSRLISWLFSFVPLQNPNMGALPTLFAATAESVQSGDFYGPDGWLTLRGHPTKEISTATSRSEAHAKQLWTLSEDTLGAKFEL